MKNNTDLIDINNINVNERELVFDRLLKYVLSVKNPYQFNVNGTKVKVSFSNKKNAPDIESALVKIACNKGR